MKRTLLTVLFMASIGCLMAQPKVVKSALSEAKATSPNFTEAKQNIKAALENPETKDEAKTWYVAGFVEQRIYEIERDKQILKQKPDENLMYTALFDMYNYYLKAADLDQQPNAKGKVKPAHLKDIVKSLNSAQSDYINGGAYFFDAKSYQQAYDLFRIFNEIPTLDFMKDPKAPATNAVDSVALQIEYYAALAVTQIEGADELAIQCLTELKDKDYKSNEVYQYLAYQYEQMKDTVNLISVYQEGAKKFKTEPYYIQNLINLYIYTNRTTEAIKYLDEALETDPENAQYWNVKGTLYETEGDLVLAMESFQAALKLDAENTAALANVGRLHYNAAVLANDEVNTIMNDAEYKARKESDVIPKFKEALPYFEKAHELAPDEREYMVALRGIYYNLNDGENMKAIEAKMNM